MPWRHKHTAAAVTSTWWWLGSVAGRGRGTQAGARAGDDHMQVQWSFVCAVPCSLCLQRPPRFSSQAQETNPKSKSFGRWIFDHLGNEVRGLVEFAGTWRYNRLRNRTSDHHDGRLIARCHYLCESTHRFARRSPISASGHGHVESGHEKTPFHFARAVRQAHRHICGSERGVVLVW